MTSMCYNHASQPANGSPINIHQLFPARTEQECLAELRKHPRSFFAYQNMSPEWKNRFLGFMEGTKTLPLTYDPFFKKLFNPDIYPERLSSLISSIIGTRVTVQCILSNEDSMLPSTIHLFFFHIYVLPFCLKCQTLYGD